MQKEGKETNKRRTLLEMVKNVLKSALDDVDECSDEELSDVVGKLNCERYGFIKESEYINTDKAMKFLGIGSRNKFFEYTRTYGVENRKINNMPIGFNKRDIEMIYEKVNGKKKHFQ